MSGPWDDIAPEVPAAAPSPAAPPSPPGITQAITFPALDVTATPPPEKKGSAIGGINRDIGPWQPDYKAPPTPPDADISEFNKVAQSNLTKHLSEQAAKAAAPTPPGQPTGPEAPATTPAQEAKGFYDAVEAGFQMSVDGLIKRHALPDMVLPQNAEWFLRTAAFAGETAGDLKSMLAGGAIGAGIGAEATPVGAAVAGAAGAFGLPALMRQSLINEYQKGSISNFSDFWQRASGTFVAGMKGAVTGAATELAGVAGAAAPYIGGPLTGWLAKYAAMTNIGTALDGHIANRQDYLDSATAMLGYHAVSMATGAAAASAEKVAGKLGDIYAKTGIHPAEVVLAAQTNPVLLQDVLSNNLTVPESLKASIDPKLQEPIAGTVKPSETSNVLTGNNGREQNVEVHKSEIPAEKEKPEETPPTHPIDKQIVWGGGQGKKQATTFNKLFARVFDQLDPVKQARNALYEGGDAIKVIDDPYWLRRLMNGANAKAKEAITGDGPRDFEGNKTGTPPLAKIVESHKDDRVGFTRYLVAATNLERAEKGVKTGFQIEGENGLREIVAQGKGQYDKAARQITDLMNDSLDKLVAAGVVEKGLAAASKEKYKYYSPQYQETETGPAMGRKSTTFKKIAGKEMGAKVLDPIDKIIQTIYARERIVAHNESVKALGKLVEYNEPAIGETVAQKIKAEGPDLVQEAELSDPNIVEKLTSKPGEVTYFEKGQRVTLRVPDDVAKAIDGIGPKQANLLVDAARPFAQLERAGAINSFSFLTRHILRSEGQAQLLSENGYIHTLGFMRGLFHTMLGTDVFQDARYMGALQETIQSLHDNYIAKDVFALQKQTGMMDSIPNLLKSPAAATRAALDFMHEKMVTPIANAPRVEEYRLAMKGKERTRENMLEAAKAARQVLPDSSRMGNDAAIKAFSQITPFWNVHLQGSLRLAEAFRDRPTATLLKGGLTMTAPAMLLWYANRDDKDIQQTDNYTRDLTLQFVDHNWKEATDIQQRTWPDHLLRKTPWGTVEADNKVIYKAPKPFEPGVLFMSLFERMADAIYKKDPHAFEGFDRTIEESLKAAPLPAFMAPVAEQWANKSTLTGAPIVPHRLEGLLPKAQYTDYTSETAKQIGSIIGKIPVVRDIGPENAKLASPLVIDNYVRSWLGGTGQLAVKLVDKALEATHISPPDQKAAPGPADTPYVGAFIWRYPNTNARSIREFFDRSAQNKRELDTFQYLIQHKDALEGVNTLIDSMEKGNASSLEGIKTALSGMQKVTADLALVPDQNMPKSDKRQLTDGLMYKSVEIATQGNKAFDAFEAAMKSRGPELEALRKKIEALQENTRAPKSVEQPQSTSQIPAQISAPPTPQTTQAAPPAPTPISKPPKQSIPSPTQTLTTNKIEEGLKKAETGQ